MFLQPPVDEPDSSSAAAKSSGDESSEKTTNKSLTTNADPYDFDSQEKKSKVVQLKTSTSYWCLYSIHETFSFFKRQLKL